MRTSGRLLVVCSEFLSRAARAESVSRAHYTGTCMFIIMSLYGAGDSEGCRRGVGPGA
jgi:hypothetical protein